MPERRCAWSGLRFGASFVRCESCQIIGGGMFPVERFSLLW